MPLPPPYSEVYTQRKKQIFELLKAAIHDPKTLTQMMKEFNQPSLGKKIKAGFRGIKFLLKNRNELSALNFIESYYQPQAIKLWQILIGERINDPDPNFFIELLKDPETQAFLKENKEVLNTFLDNISPEILSFVMNLKAMEPVMAFLADYGFKPSYIQEQLRPDLVKYIQAKIQNPEKAFELINGVAGLLVSPSTRLSENSFKLAKQVAKTLQSFLKEPDESAPNKAMISLVKSLFIIPSKEDSKEAIQKWDTKLIINLSAIIKRPELSVLALALPAYLAHNKADIVDKVTVNLATIKKTLTFIPEDFSVPLVQKLLGTGIDLSEELLPFGVELLQEILADKNKKVLLDITGNVRKLQNQDPNDNHDSIKILINSVFELDVDHYVIDYLPGILEKHANPLGEVLREFLTQTQKGRELVLYIQTHKILEMVSQHMPQIASISRAYTRGEPWFWQACQLLKDKAVLKLVFQTFVNYIAYKYREKIQSSLIRRLRIGDPMRTILKSYQPGGNLGDFLRGKARDTKNTLEYSLMTRDLSGLKISDKLSELTIEDFKFDHAILENISFENSTIINCSFKNVKFKNKPNFKNITIDEISLKTLQPAIELYNKKHPDDPIAIRQAKVHKPKELNQASFLKKK